MKMIYDVHMFKTSPDTVFGHSILGLKNAGLTHPHNYWPISFFFPVTLFCNDHLWTSFSQQNQTLCALHCTQHYLRSFICTLNLLHCYLRSPVVFPL